LMLSSAGLTSIASEGESTRPRRGETLRRCQPPSVSGRGPKMWSC
jgi:hypothetical protein